MSDYVKMIIIIALIVLVVVALMPDITIAATVIVLITNIFVLSSHLLDKGDISIFRDTPKDSFDPGADLDSLSIDLSQITQKETSQDKDDDGDKVYTYIYDEDERQYNRYKAPYHIHEPKRVMVGDTSIDNGNVDYAIKHERTEDAMIGSLSKSTDFYKHHYKDEFEEYEKLPWWGQYEF